MSDQSTNLSEQTFYISGMHCASCELIIEKRLLAYPSIQAADVSIGNATAVVYTDNETRLNIDQLNEQFNAIGYQFSKKPFKHPSKNPLSKKKLVGIVALFIFLFFLLERMQFGQFISVDASSSLPAFFLLGIVAGLSSCAALIGGILLSLTKQWNEQHLITGTGTRSKPHVLFHGGRLVSFFVLGGFLGVLGDAISLNNTLVYSILVLGVSLMMLLLGLQMLGVPFAARLQMRLPKSLTRRVASTSTKQHMRTPFILGALTFFLPCGFTLIAQGIALTTGSALKGAFIMLFFALGTLPLLIGISATGLSATANPKRTASFLKVAGLIILFFALYNINGQLNVLGLPSLSDVRLSSSEEAVTCDPRYSSCLNQQGEQEVKLIAREFQYLADGPTVFQAGVPTKLIVNGQNVLGCAAFIASRGLIDGFIPLDNGRNVIDVGTPSPGTYKLTCSMGMVAPLAITFK